MNKKNLFLGLAILFCANQASAGFVESIKSGLNDVASWFISWLPESWQLGACSNLGLCSSVALTSGDQKVYLGNIAPEQAKGLNQIRQRLGEPSV